MKITILGCGGSMGVPQLGNLWGACDPKNPKNRRLRSSIIVQQNNVNILIDTGPDLRQQLLAARVDHLDAVLYTHAHSDHTHGVNDLRPFCLQHRKPINIYGDKVTLEELKRFFPVGFTPLPEKGNIYRLHLTPHIIDEAVDIGPFHIEAFCQDHGHGMQTLGYKINRMAYSTDVKGLSKTVLNQLKGELDVWIVDCYKYEEHSTHSHFDQTLAWIEYVNPKQAILTHMSEDMDYETLEAQLPKHITPAYDGMVIDTNSQS